MLTHGDIHEIQPFFNSAEIGRYLFALQDILPIFFGVAVIAIIPLSKVNGKQIKRLSPLFVLLIGVFMVYVAETSVTIIGVSDVVNYKDALLVALRETEVPALQIFQRLDFLFLTFGLMGIFCLLSLLFYTSVEFLVRLFPRWNRAILFPVIGVITYIMGYIPQNSDMLWQMYKMFNLYTGIATTFLIPLVLIIFMKVKKNAV